MARQAPPAYALPPSLDLGAYNELSVSLDPNQQALWWAARHRGVPCFTLQLLEEIKAVRDRARKLVRERQRGALAPVKFLLPEHRVLTIPNKIGPADFDGWVQERGAYFPSSWDEARHEAVLAMSDPGEAPLRSSLLVARHGKGHYVYTGLAFFRQLPAGVPGAYRLFANLLALGSAP